MNEFFDTQFNTHEDFEKRHFWSLSKRACLYHLIHRHVSKDAKILEVGASTCLITKELFDQGYQNISAGDMNQKAVAYAKTTFPQLKDRFYKLNIENLNHPDTFECILHSELLEHVDDNKALSEIHNALKKDGLTIFSVPALPLLFSRFDEMVHHKRRYTQSMLSKVLLENSFEILYCSYFFMSLLPLLLPTRLIQKFFSFQTDPNPLKVPPKYINQAFKILMGMEFWIWKKIRLPIGSSLFVVARKR